MKENVVPEEKLLRLIRGKSKPPAAKQPAFRKIKLNIHKIITLAFIISCIHLAASFIHPFIASKEIDLSEASERKDILADPKLKEEMKPFEYYLEGIKNRQIFAGSSLAGADRTMGKISPDLNKDINLVGIISGDNPQAIIEDKSTQKTYYLSKGQFIGESQVEDIQEGKIVLNHRGKRFELYL